MCNVDARRSLQSAIIHHQSSFYLLTCVNRSSFDECLVARTPGEQTSLRVPDFRVSGRHPATISFRSFSPPHETKPNPQNNHRLHRQRWSVECDSTTRDSFTSHLLWTEGSSEHLMSLPQDVPLSILTFASQSLPTEVASILPSPTPSSLIPSATASSLAFSIATAAANATAPGVSRPGAEGGECKLLGPFALFIQGALGLLALLSLVFKRWRERPQRPVKIWAFDASKQVVGSSLLHIANLLMSMISSGELTSVKAEDYQANPCSFYLLNLAIDVSYGPPAIGTFAWIDADIMCRPLWAYPSSSSSSAS